MIGHGRRGSAAASLGQRAIADRRVVRKLLGGRRRRQRCVERCLRRGGRHVDDIAADDLGRLREAGGVGRVALRDA
eukprot:792188-Prymnesium_polylepis.1